MQLEPPCQGCKGPTSASRLMGRRRVSLIGRDLTIPTATQTPPLWIWLIIKRSVHLRNFSLILPGHVKSVSCCNGEEHESILFPILTAGMHLDDETRHLCHFVCTVDLHSCYCDWQELVALAADGNVLVSRWNRWSLWWFWRNAVCFFSSHLLCSIWLWFPHHASTCLFCDSPPDSRLEAGLVHCMRKEQEAPQVFFLVFFF